MTEDNVVSIWLGKLETEEIFKDFISEKYDEDGDMSSAFMTSFCIDYIDTDFQEVFFQEVITIDDLSQASYAKSFIDQIDEDMLRSCNCAILAYDHNYSGEIKSSGNLSFIGSYQYRKS